MVQRKAQESLELKIGPQMIEILPETDSEKMYYELIADYINKKYVTFKETYVELPKTYAHTVFEIAKEQFNLRKTIEGRINKLETAISNLIEQIDTVLQSQEE